MICIPIEKSVKKTNFSSDQLSISDSYWVRACVCFSSQYGTPSGLDDYIYSACSQYL